MYEDWVDKLFWMYLILKSNWNTTSSKIFKNGEKIKNTTQSESSVEQHVENKPKFLRENTRELIFRVTQSIATARNSTFQSIQRVQQATTPRPPP